MIDWLITTLRMILDGTATLVAGTVRLGLVALALLILGAYIRALIKEPRAYIRGTFALIVALLIGIAFPLVVFTLIPTMPGWVTLLLWPLGWFFAYKAWVLISAIPEDQQ